MPPTPCKEGAGGWDLADSIDYEKVPKMLDLPDDYKKFAEAHTRGWFEMRKKYIGVKAG